MSLGTLPKELQLWASRKQSSGVCTRKASICGIWAAAAGGGCAWGCPLQPSICFLCSWHHPDPRCSWYLISWALVPWRLVLLSRGVVFWNVFVSTDRTCVFPRDLGQDWFLDLAERSGHLIHPHKYKLVTSYFLACLPYRILSLKHLWISEITKEQINKGISKVTVQVRETLSACFLLNWGALDNVA